MKIALAIAAAFALMTSANADVSPLANFAADVSAVHISSQSSSRVQLQTGELPAR